MSGLAGDADRPPAPGHSARIDTGAPIWSPSAMTTVAAVIGDPVTHSRSPAIHNAGFRVLDLDWVYVAWQVVAGDGGAAVQAVRTLGLGGLSVTMPHKRDAALAVDRCSESAARLGVVNCVARDGATLVGHNTDGEGFVASLVAAGIDPSGADVVVVGAGGAARAVIVALAGAGVDQVRVCNRDPVRREAAAALAGARGREGSLDDVRSADLVVNATPVGMAGNTGLSVPAELLGDHQVVADLVYDPLRTELLVAAQQAGATTVDGLGMLVHQAALAFELWTGREAPLEAMSDAARAAPGDVV